MRASRIVHLAGLAGFSAWMLFKVFTHVPWFDELHAQLIAREAGDLSELFRNLAYEGHPSLWHLILHGVSAVSGDPAILAWVQAPIAVGILALIWFAMPFGWIEKSLISASYYISFEYGVLARSYGLGVLLFFGAVALRHSPWAWVLLGLMANISVHFMLLGGALGLLLLWRGPRSIWGITACLAMVAIALVTAWPAADVIPPQPLEGLVIQRVILNLAHLSAVLIPITIEHGASMYWSPIMQELGYLPLAAIGLTVPVIGAVSLRRRPLMALCFVALCGSILFIGVAIYTQFPRHYGAAFILLIGLHWILREEGIERRSVIVTGWLALCATGGAWTAYWSTGVPFSEGRAFASWVRDRGMQDQLWAAYPGAAGTDFAAYLGKPTYNLEARRWNTFMHWDYPIAVRPSVSGLSDALTNPPERSFYFVSYSEWVRPEMVAALSDRGVEMQEIARFDNPGAIFKFTAYRVTVDH